MNRRHWKLVGGLVFTTAPLWLFPLAWWLTFSPNAVVSWTGHLLAQTEFAYTLAFLAACVFALCAPVLLCYRRHRWLALQGIALTAVFVLCFFVGLGWGRQVRFQELACLPDRAQPLVDAITAYEAKNGRLPDSLDDLTPQHLDHIPNTGVGHHPNFYYFKVDPKTHRGNSWVLHGPCPGVVMAFDSFSYYPRRNYEEFGLSSIGNWGYSPD